MFNRQAILMYNMCILHAPLIADPEETLEGTGELALGSRTDRRPSTISTNTRSA